MCILILITSEVLQSLEEKLIYVSSFETHLDDVKSSIRHCVSRPVIGVWGKKKGQTWLLFLI